MWNVDGVYITALNAGTGEVLWLNDTADSYYYDFMGFTESDEVELGSNSRWMGKFGAVSARSKLNGIPASKVGSWFIWDAATANSPPPR